MTQFALSSTLIRARATSTLGPHLAILAHHVRRILIHSLPHSSINRNTGLLSPYIKREITPSSRLLPKRQCREQGAKAVQSKCSQARQRYGIGQHRASPALLHEDGVNHQEGVRLPLFIPLVNVPHNRNHCYPGPSREMAFLRMDLSIPPTPKTPRWVALQNSSCPLHPHYPHNSLHSHPT